jgi:hypothetical protein
MDRWEDGPMHKFTIKLEPLNVNSMLQWGVLQALLVDFFHFCGCLKVFIIKCGGSGTRCTHSNKYLTTFYSLVLRKGNGANAAPHYMPALVMRRKPK